MNQLFTLKLGTLLLASLMFGRESVNAQTENSTAAASAWSARGIAKNDSTFVIRAGARIVHHSDTIMVIGGDLAKSAVTGQFTAEKHDAVEESVKRDSPVMFAEQPQALAVIPAPAIRIASDPGTEPGGIGVKEQSAFLELGGPGLAISGNYDARLHNTRTGWGYRVGMGYFGASGNTVFTIPLQVNYLYGERNHHLELGAGTTFLHSNGTNVGNSVWEFDRITGFIGTGTIGYRYQPARAGITFGAAFVPIVSDEGLIMAGGINVGYTFK